MAFPGLPWHCQPQGHQQRLRARLSPDGTLTGIPKINTKMNINTLEYMWCRVICIGNGYIVHMHEYIRKMAQSPRTLKKSYIRIVRKCVFNIHDSWIHTVGPNKCIECTQSLGPGFGGDELTTRSALKILKSTHHTSYTSALICPEPLGRSGSARLLLESMAAKQRFLCPFGPVSFQDWNVMIMTKNGKLRIS